MSHQHLAAVWDQLQGRHDVANILREIIGQHVADLAVLQLQEDLVAHVESLMRPVAWIKVIFDLQRAYLQATSGKENSASHGLLPSETVFSTLMYLIQVKSRLFPTQTLTIREFAKYRYFTGQTLLSGLRLLLLLNEYLPASKKSNLERAVTAVWQHARLPESEQFLIFDLLPSAIDCIRTSRPDDDRDAPSGAVYNFLPTYAEGLYPLDVDLESILPQAFAGLCREGPDSVRAFWAIFDVLWAVEAAQVNCQMDLYRQTLEQEYVQDSDTLAETALEQLESVRESLFSSVFESQTSSSILCALTSTLVGWYETPPGSATSMKAQEYTRIVADMKTDFENALKFFKMWLINRALCLRASPIENTKQERLSRHFHSHMRDWVQQSSTSDSDYQSRDLDQIYIVNCANLHPVPKAVLEDKLRLSDKLKAEEIYDGPPFITLDMLCPQCDKPIKWARMIEPLEQMSVALQGDMDDDMLSSPRSARPSDSLGNRSRSSRSDGLSHSTSLSSGRVDSAEPHIRPPSSALVSPLAEPSANPLSETLFSPLSARSAPSLLKRQSVRYQQHSPTATPPPTATTLMTSTNTTTMAPPTPTPKKPPVVTSREVKPIRMHLTRTTTSFKSKPSKHVPLPSDPAFAFSTSGTSLIFWGRGREDHGLVRFDLSVVTGVFKDGCVYDISDIETAAVGDQRCAVVASNGECRKVVVYNGRDTFPTGDFDVDGPLGTVPGICVAVSPDDRFAAVAVNDHLQVYEIHGRHVRRILLHDQTLPPGEQTGPVHTRTGPLTRNLPNNANKKALSWHDMEQEKKRQSAVIERKLWFSTTSDKLIVATHLADHHVYLTLWDCAKEPWTTSGDYSRSLPLPPWTTNDGDLTSVFYDNFHRSAFITAYLGKEYPLTVPIPGFDRLRNDITGSKITHAAQSPSGVRFAVANGMTEIYLIDYKANGNLSPRKLKKAASKISTNSFKPGNLIVAMPNENTLLAFWIKDSKLMLRTTKINAYETVSDFDLRPSYDKLYRDQVNAPQSYQYEFRKPSIGLDPLSTMTSALSISEMDTRHSLIELPSRIRSIQELPGE